MRAGERKGEGERATGREGERDGDEIEKMECIKQYVAEESERKEL